MPFSERIVFLSSTLLVIAVMIPKAGTSQSVYAVSQMIYANANHTSLTVSLAAEGIIKIAIVAAGVSAHAILSQGIYF